jgi:TolB-like protein/Flp pilus assembly protein TadD
MNKTERRLDSWKEIAAHFNRDVTTVRRWERREGLPVHRHLHRSRGSVYAYAGELDEWWANRCASPAARHEDQGTPPPVPRARPSFVQIVPLIGLAALSLSMPPAASGIAGISSLAVLPFVPSSASADEDYVSDGLTDAVIDSLAAASGLRVIARASVNAYRARPTPLDAIAAQLHVDALITGATTIEGRRIGLTVTLVQPSNGRRLWQGRYSADVNELLSLERSLLDDLSRALGRDPRTQRSRPATLDAYWAYVQGRRDWNRRTLESLREAVRLFRQAAELDPQFALAYAGAADAESLLGYYRAAPLDESLARAEAAARRALALNGTLAEAHAALGQVYLSRWNWQEADLAYRRALQLNPNYATARHWYSNYLSIVARDDEAIAQARLAVALDPLSPIVRSGALANALRRAGRHDEALAEYARALALDPSFWNARMGQAITYANKAMRDQAMREAALVAGLRPTWTAAAASIYGTFGAVPEARRLLRTVEQSEEMSAVSLAQAHAAIGETGRAVSLLRLAFERRDPDLAPAVREPWFDRLRGDARMTAMVQALGLPRR